MGPQAVHRCEGFTACMARIEDTFVWKMCQRVDDGDDSGVDESMHGSGKWSAFGECWNVLLSGEYVEWGWTVEERILHL